MPRLPLSRFVDLLDSLRGSFWFVPGVMVLISVALAMTMVWVDRELGERAVALTPIARLISPASAHSILSTLAGSMITLAGVVFSITIVALTLASAQFGPRLLRSFMRDRTTKVVLGTFVSIFIYSLVVLYAVGNREDARFVPHLAVAVALLLAFAGLGVLVFFFHHVSTSIHASQVIASVAEELSRQVEILFPDRVGEESDTVRKDECRALRARLEREGVGIATNRDGYVRVIDAECLLRIATEHDLVIAIETTPGQFVLPGAALMHVLSKEGLPDDLIEPLRATVTVGPQRTSLQDIEFCIDQLVEIALRALSPGINDPATAISCVHRLGSAVVQLAHRSFPEAVRNDANGDARVLIKAPEFADLVALSFDRIRRAAGDHVEVSESIDRVLELAAGLTDHPGKREILRRARRGAVGNDVERVTGRSGAELGQ